MKENILPEIDLREVVKINVRCMEFFGYFCPDFKKTTSKIIYYVYSFFFVGFMLFVYILSESANMYFVFGSMEKMTEASFLFLTHLVQATKLYVLVVHNARVRQLINSINRKEFKPKNLKQYRLLKEDIKLMKILTTIFLFMGFATCSMWGIFPLMDRKKGEKIRLPLSGWFPFDTEKSPAFELAYIFLSLGSMVNGLANISMDSFLAGIVVVISSQLKVLNNAFKILELKNGRISKDVNCKDDSIRLSFIENIIHHKNIMEFADEMTDLFTACIMNQFIVSVIIICLTMFQMSLVPVASYQFLSMVLYQGCIVLEIFLWCYFGNEVILQSGKLTKSAYMCEWVDCPKDFKTDLLYFMTRSQITLKLYAGGYFTLSLDTFMAIAKTSWSYFAVLNRVHSKDD